MTLIKSISGIRGTIGGGAGEGLNRCSPYGAYGGNDKFVVTGRLV